MSAFHNFPDTRKTMFRDRFLPFVNLLSNGHNRENMEPNAGSAFDRRGLQLLSIPTSRTANRH